MKNWLSKLLRWILGTKSYATLAQFLWQDARNELPVDYGADSVRALLQIVLPSSTSPATLLLCNDNNTFAADALRLLPKSAEKHRLFCWEPDAQRRDWLQAQLSPYASLADIRYLADQPSLDSWCQQESVNNLRLLRIGAGVSALVLLKGASSMLANGRIDFICVDYGPEWIERRELLKDLIDLAQANDYQVLQLTRSGLLPVNDWYPDRECFQRSRFLLKSWE